jgi:hypothetical protein
MCGKNEYDFLVYISLSTHKHTDAKTKSVIVGTKNDRCSWPQDVDWHKCLQHKEGVQLLSMACLS